MAKDALALMHGGKKIVSARSQGDSVKPDKRGVDERYHIYKKRNGVCTYAVAGHGLLSLSIILLPD